MKVVINRRYGGFGLSHEATMEFARRKGITIYPFVGARGPDGRLKFGELVPYVPGKEKPFCLHYATAPEYDASKYYLCAPERNDPDLIAIVEEWGEKANGECARLEIVEIPDGVQWEIDEYDGMESVEEAHRSWP